MMAMCHGFSPTWECRYLIHGKVCSDYWGRALGLWCQSRDISQINFFLSLVNAKRVLFSPLVIVGFQIFERPSGGRYGGRWISDGYFKSNIWWIFGVEKSISYETGSNPRLRVNVAKSCCGRIPFDHRCFISSPTNRYIPLSFGDLTFWGLHPEILLPPCSIPARDFSQALNGRT